MDEARNIRVEQACYTQITTQNDATGDTQQIIIIKQCFGHSSSPEERQRQAEARLKDPDYDPEKPFDFPDHPFWGSS